LAPLSNGDDIVVSIGELTTPGDCASVIKPIVIKVAKGETEVEVPINVCNVAGREIDTVTIEMGYDASVLWVKEGSARPSDDIVGLNWQIFMPNYEKVKTEGFFKIIMRPGGADAPMTSDGELLYVTFETDKGDPDLVSPGPTLTSVTLEDLEPDAPSTIHPVDIIGNDIALPVTLSALGAMWNPDGGIRVFWEAESQRENLGWNVYRSETEDGKYVKINGDLIKGAGTTANPIKYDFVDEDAIGGKSFFYYLENISFDGEKYRSHIIEAILVNQLSSWGAIKNSSLRQTPLASHGTQKPIVFVKIYDAKGNLIRDLKKTK
jgi:hypothetical protein